MIRTALFLVAAGLAPAARTDDDLPESLRTLYRAQNDFALELHRALHPDGAAANAFHSPVSVWSALALLAEGARGETASELIGLLAAAEDDVGTDVLHEVAADLRRRLEAAGEHVTIESANALWGQDGFAFSRSVLEALASHYGAGLEGLDFVHDAEGARRHINAWVAERTRDRIEDLLPEGSLTDLTRFVLTNAVYFLGDWAEPFDPGLTTDRPFRLADGGEVRVPFVRDTEGRSIPLASFDAEWTARIFEDGSRGGFLALELPYEGNRVSFMALVPDEVGGLAALEADLDGAKLEQVTAALAAQRVRFSMPKLELRPSYDLIPAAKRLGLSRVFSPDTSDLSGFVDGPSPDLYVTGAFHQAFVRIDEQGTEAAAATGVVVGVRSMPLPSPEVVLDRPFLFVVRERTSGAVLFLGRVDDPS